MNTYQALELEYNHRDSIAEAAATGQALRPAVMITNPDSRADGIAGALAQMRGQGYVIVSAVVETYCAACNGTGRTNKTRKVRTKRGTETRIIPYSYIACKACNGHDGPLSRVIVPVEQA